jgi:hypothetical protein
VVHAYKSIFSKIVATAVSISWGSQFATAQQVAPACGPGGANNAASISGIALGGASISATEASTTQVLEVMSQRRIREAQRCPTGSTRVGGVCRAVAVASVGSVQVNSYVAPDVSDSGAQTKGGAALPSPPEEKMHLGQKTYSPSALNQGPNYGAWIEGFFDHDKRSNLPGGQTREQRTNGYLAGFDTNIPLPAASSQLKVGVLGGYSTTTQKFLPTRSTENVDTTLIGTVPGTSAAFPDLVEKFIFNLPHTSESTTEQEITSRTGGIYLSYVTGGFFNDLLGKVDWGSLSRRTTGSDTFSRGFKNTTVQLNADPTKIFPPPGSVSGCFVPSTVVFDTPTTEVFDITQTTSLTSFTLSNSVGYHFSLANNYWFEPSATVLFTYAHFASSADALGLKDGHTLRLQGGGRVGHSQLVGKSFVWTNSVGAFLYSDVIIDGYVISADAFSAAGLEADEGKVRGLGVLQTRLDFSNGTSLYAEANGRVGDDYRAYGGKIGGRIEW